jgi:hypothetical protein
MAIVQQDTYASRTASLGCRTVNTMGCKVSRGYGEANRKGWSVTSYGYAVSKWGWIEKMRAGQWAGETADSEQEAGQWTGGWTVSRRDWTVNRRLDSEQERLDCEQEAGQW